MNIVYIGNDAVEATGLIGNAVVCLCMRSQSQSAAMEARFWFTVLLVYPAHQPYASPT